MGKKEMDLHDAAVKLIYTFRSMIAQHTVGTGATINSAISSRFTALLFDYFRKFNAQKTVDVEIITQDFTCALID